MSSVQATRVSPTAAAPTTTTTRAPALGAAADARRTPGAPPARAATAADTISKPAIAAPKVAIHVPTKPAVEVPSATARMRAAQAMQDALAALVRLKPLITRGSSLGVAIGGLVAANLAATALPVAAAILGTAVALRVAVHFIPDALPDLLRSKSTGPTILDAPSEFNQWCEQIHEPHKIAGMVPNAKFNLMMVGPPGTGKTANLRKATLERGWDLMVLEASEVESHLRGRAIRNLRAKFEAARALTAKTDKPVLVFIDEIDGFLAHDPQFTTELLQHMDGIRTEAGHKVYVVAGTNRPELLPASLRSRLTYTVHFPLPDAQRRLNFVRERLTHCRHAIDAEGMNKLSEMFDGLSYRDMDGVWMPAAGRARLADRDHLQVHDFVEALKEWHGGRSFGHRPSRLDLGSLLRGQDTAPNAKLQAELAELRRRLDAVELRPNAPAPSAPATHALLQFARVRAMGTDAMRKLFGPVPAPQAPQAPPSAQALNVPTAANAPEVASSNEDDDGEPGWTSLWMPEFVRDGRA